MGASNPNGTVLLKEDEFTTEYEIMVSDSEYALLKVAFGLSERA